LDNKEIALVLAETADLMEIAGDDSFRIRSYRNGAVAVESNRERLADILRAADRSVQEVPGIGKGLAAIIASIVETGTCTRRDELLQRFPPTALEFLKIQGLGPKSIALIFEHFRIASIDELEKLCLEQKLRELPRMGAKLEEKVLRSIAQYRLRTGRFLLPFADQTAQDLAAYIKEDAGVESVIFAGSLRRGRETIGDLDLLITGHQTAAALDRVATYPRVHQILGRGPNKTSVQLGREGFQVDVRALPAESTGAALQYFTGSKEHNVAVRIRAVRQGLKLSEYGLFRAEDEARVAGETEEGVYAALGLQWVPPEMRENWGEIELAAEHALPTLVTQTDLRGDVHMHTTETDGRATLEEMAEEARALGYEYIAITDHSKSLAMSNGLDEARVEAFAKRVQRLNESGSLGIRVFSGIECDILKDGAMDLSWDALAALDLVIGSVHSHQNLEAAEMTDRLLAAMECPSLRVLGHPTGRLLLSRDAYAYDFERVVDQAVQRRVILEVNASPERLDLGAHLIRGARTRGARFMISTDAHHPKHLLNMRFGVMTARRGWLTANDVVNTLPAERFAEAIRRIQ
jgi:DNA polymerase (family 10)